MSPRRIVIRNLVLLVCGILPLFWLSVFGTLLLIEPRDGAWRNAVPEALAGAVGVSVMTAVPVVALGFVHQVLLAGLPHELSQRRTRAAILVGTTSISVAAAAFLASSYGHFSFFAGALLPSATLYGALLRPVRPAHDS